VSATVIGTLNATGASVDEIIAGAREQIARVAGDRTFGIKRAELRPLLIEGGGEIRIWDADVEVEIFNAETQEEGDRACARTLIRPARRSLTAVARS
jgi:hypothetical protein